MSSTSDDQTHLDTRTKSFGWVMRSLLSVTDGVKAFLWIPDTIFFDAKAQEVKAWMHTTRLGFVASIPPDQHSIDLILQRFARLNNIHSPAKPSFLNQELYGPWYVSTNYLDVQNRFFANVFYRAGTVEPMALKHFVELCEKILAGEPEVYKTVRAIQAYRDHRVPLVATKSRETFTHCVEYRESKYYSLIKNQRGESVLDVNLERLLLSNTKVVINCIEINRRLMVDSIQLVYLYDGIDKLWLQHSDSCYVSDPSYEHRSIQVADIVESSFQLRNFAEIAVQLPRLVPTKKLTKSPDPRLWGGYTKPDQRTLTMRWPHEILKVHKSTVTLRQPNPQFSHTVKSSRPFMPRQKSELRMEVAQPQSMLQAAQLPLAINKYIRPGKQSPKAVLYYKPKTQQQIRGTLEPVGMKKSRLLPPQQCCGSFCNYAKIVVDESQGTQMRRISRKHLEIAKEYENLIELFFKENEDLVKLSAEYNVAPRTVDRLRNESSANPGESTTGIKDKSSMLSQVSATQDSVLVCPRCYIMYNVLHRAYIAKSK